MHEFHHFVHTSKEQYWEVHGMGKNKFRQTNRGTKAPGVNPQGYGQDAEFAEEPKSELELRAKKSNTKI